MTTGRLGTFLGSLRGQILLVPVRHRAGRTVGESLLRNDDWSYARVVDGLVNRGVIDVAQGWVFMNFMSVVAEQFSREPSAFLTSCCAFRPSRPR